MFVRIKRALALALAMLMLLSVMAGCANSGGNEDTKTKATEPPEEAAVLKVLTLGHSLTVDACHMLNLVAAAEGYKDMLIGTLYYSGCPLNKHVEYLTKDTPAYSLYISSTTTPGVIPVITDDVTMGYALQYEYWDIIVMQGGVFEVAESDTYTCGHIQTIQEYVNKMKLNPLAIFAWHMPWVFPTNNDLRDTFPKETNGYYTNYAKYDHNRTNLYNAMTKCVSDHIMTDDTFQFMIPSGTAIENALSSYMEETDLHRDYAHATDIGRLMAAYTYYCRLAGVEQLEQIKLDVVPKIFFKSSTSPVDWELTDHEKELILESVNNALANPLQMTQSKFTEAPAQ